jgi:siroheme synthase (precorrin-2 oxidase/ferrochelatase)
MRFEEYVSEKKIKDSNEEEEKKEIIVSIIKTKMELDNNRKNFEFAEEELIDYYLYQIKANQSKLDYLIKKAKDKKIMVNLVDKIKYDAV